MPVLLEERLITRRVLRVFLLEKGVYEARPKGVPLGECATVRFFLRVFL